MDLFAQAKAQGIQTEFLDGQGHRRVTDAAALKIILDALPPQAPGPLVGQPVVVRSGRTSRTKLPHPTPYTPLPNSYPETLKLCSTVYDCFETISTIFIFRV